ncbi:DUF309 domain-containing protein [Paenibacillus turpanensis]|uniref:DUF309 domain-containing protein n=1 Tax=Paenibacillus turpanensis TaxID=2689078 RepID=UPI001408C224|nr:DUF309 domain-containing protein [Paenibacillus turpanensis]
MQLIKEYVDYLVSFHAERDYFECHEIMEEFWKEHPEHPNRIGWLMLIQVAVGAYHARRGNLPGARKMWGAALEKVSGGGVDFEAMALDGARLEADLRERLAELAAAGEEAERDYRYREMDLPLADAQLAEVCRREAEQRGLIWGAPSDMSRRELIDRHTLRDRSDVIEARREELERRQSERG